MGDPKYSLRVNGSLLHGEQNTYSIREEISNQFGSMPVLSLIAILVLTLHIIYILLLSFSLSFSLMSLTYSLPLSTNPHSTFLL